MKYFFQTSNNIRFIPDAEVSQFKIDHPSVVVFHLSWPSGVDAGAAGGSGLLKITEHY